MRHWTNNHKASVIGVLHKGTVPGTQPEAEGGEKPLGWWDVEGLPRGVGWRTREGGRGLLLRGQRAGVSDVLLPSQSCSLSFLLAVCCLMPFSDSQMNLFV